MESLGLLIGNVDRFAPEESAARAVYLRFQQDCCFISLNARHIFAPNSHWLGVTGPRNSNESTE